MGGFCGLSIQLMLALESLHGDACTQDCPHWSFLVITRPLWLLMGGLGHK